MIVASYYISPIGNILLASDGGALVGSWFEGQKNFPSVEGKSHVFGDDEIIQKAKRWLDEYFAGMNQKILFNLQPVGTAFQKQVWELLQEIPYGQTTTYGEIASRIAVRKGIKRMSSRAVGAAIGQNPLSIFIPCHRVIGEDGKLTGYAGGIERKKFLLELEGTCFNCSH